MKEKYTQREWDRVVGIGKVPEEHRYEPPSKTTDEEVAYDRARRGFELGAGIVLDD